MSHQLDNVLLLPVAVDLAIVAFVVFAAAAAAAAAAAVAAVAAADAAVDADEEPADDGIDDDGFAKLS